jgi:diacylglycerol kinase (ATP)
VNEAYFTVVNPAAGGGRCGKLAARALERLRAAGLCLEVRETRGPGEATALASGAYTGGCRKFIAVGGDGTSFEMVNGLFPKAATEGRAALGFLPLGTGNSFLRDFVKSGTDLAEFGIKAILERRAHPCDVIRLDHSTGSIFYINTLNMGFAADVATLTNRRLKFLGEPGYLAGVLVSLARLRRRPFPLRVDGERDDRRCLFVAFSNSKYTGGKMMIAPHASIDSGTIEYVHWGPIGRLGLVRNLPGLFTGSHIRHPMASRRTAARIEFELTNPVDVVVDGEVLTLEARSLEVLPGALDVMV